MIKFKDIRSKVSKIFTESQQMRIIILLSSIFWWFRKYFLGVEIEYPEKFLKNWIRTKKDSSLDKERNFTLYQLINIHNEKFKNEETNIIEFGVSRGSSLKLISNFLKKKLTYLELIALDFMLMKLKNVLLVNTIKITKDWSSI